MNRLTKKIFAIVALIAFLAVSILSALPVFRANAETAEEKLNDSVKKQDEIKEEIEVAGAKKDVALAEYNELDKEIVALQITVDGVHAQVAQSEAKIDKMNQDLEKAQKECEEQYADYCERAKLLLQKGTMSYLEILIHADSFADFLTRLSLVNEIAEYDKNRLEELKEYAIEVEGLKDELEKENEVLVALKEDVDSQMAVLQDKQSQSQSLINSITSDIETYEKALKAQEEAEAAAREEIRRITLAAQAQAEAAAAKAAKEAAEKAAAEAAAQGADEQQVAQVADAAAKAAEQAAAASATYTGGSFTWPSTSSYITSTYGTRTHPVTGQLKTHTGLDISAGMGTDIYSAAGGTVIISGWNSGGYGNYVVVDHGGGLTTLYAHCSSLLVSVGQEVSAGQVIAKCGSTGISTGPHLHFEVLQNGAHTDPYAYLN